MKATDLRGGVILIIDALTLKGRIYIKNIEYILRGYEGLDFKLIKIRTSIYIEER